MNLLAKVSVVLSLSWLAACTAVTNDDVLGSATTPQAPPVPQNSSVIAANDSGPNTEIAANPGNQATTQNGSRSWPENAASFASDNNSFDEPAFIPRLKKTYLINGLASNIGNIGFGFSNLSKKIPGSVLYNYASFVESSTVIRARVTRELKAAYKKNPNLEINLIGISFGANIVTIIAQELHRSKIPVNYLATLDGPAMLPIRQNVRVTDNFTCTNIDCFKTNTRLGWGNKSTIKGSFRLKSSHIPLANHPQVHSRILQQINAVPPIRAASVQ